MSLASVQASTPLPSPLPDDVDWASWLRFDTPPPEKRRMQLVAAQLTPQLVLNLEQRNTSLRSPPIVVSPVARDNTIRPYGRVSPKRKREEPDGYFALPFRTEAQSIIHEDHRPRIEERTESALGRDLDFQARYAPVYQTHPKKVSPVVTTSAGGSPSNVQDMVMVPYGAVAPKGKKAKMSEKNRLEYKNVRTNGACPKCHSHKKKCLQGCYPYIECLRWRRNLNFLDKVINVRLFRSRPAPGTALAHTRSEIYELDDIAVPGSTRMVSLSQRCMPPISVPVGDFVPCGSLKTAYEYHTSYGSAVLDLPPICLSHIRTISHILRLYIDQTWREYIRQIQEQSDVFTQGLLQGAMRYHPSSSNGSSNIVLLALKLLAIVRMTEDHWEIAGDELPEIPLIEDFDSPWPFQRPITPVMDTQMDQIIIQGFLNPLRDQLLSELERKIDCGRSQDRFDIFLTIALLQTNFALLLRHSRKMTAQSGIHRRYKSSSLAQEYFHGSNILMAYFHHKCKGPGLLSARAADGNSDDQGQLMQKLAAQMQLQQEHMAALRQAKEYEKDLYWSHQMFFEGWIPEVKEGL